MDSGQVGSWPGNDSAQSRKPNSSASATCLAARPETVARTTHSLREYLSAPRWVWFKNIWVFRRPRLLLFSTTFSGTKTEKCSLPNPLSPFRQNDAPRESLRSCDAVDRRFGREFSHRSSVHASPGSSSGGCCRACRYHRAECCRWAEKGLSAGSGGQRSSLAGLQQRWAHGPAHCQRFNAGTPEDGRGSHGHALQEQRRWNFHGRDSTERPRGARVGNGCLCCRLRQQRNRGCVHHRLRLQCFISEQ